MIFRWMQANVFLTMQFPLCNIVFAIPYIIAAIGYLWKTGTHMKCNKKNPHQNKLTGAFLSYNFENLKAIVPIRFLNH